MCVCVRVSKEEIKQGWLADVSQSRPETDHLRPIKLTRQKNVPNGHIIHLLHMKECSFVVVEKVPAALRTCWLYYTFFFYIFPIYVLLPFLFLSHPSAAPASNSILPRLATLCLPLQVRGALGENSRKTNKFSTHISSLNKNNTWDSWMHEPPDAKIIGGISLEGASRAFDFTRLTAMMIN